MTAAEREAVIDMLRADADVEQSNSESGFCDSESGFCDEEDLSHEGAALYWSAYDAVGTTIGWFTPFHVLSLEAAALLEDGWNPGDPVERIGGAP